MKKVIVLILGFLAFLALASCTKSWVPGADNDKTLTNQSAGGTLLFTGITEESDLADEQERLSYALGAYFGTQLALFDELDFSIFLAGLKHSYNDQGEAILDEQQISQIIIAGQQRAISRAGESALKEGGDFLKKNAGRDDVTSLDNGIQYRILSEGTGPKPKSTDTIEVHYEGTLVSGEIFDSSYQRNETTVFPLQGVIQGWQEILPLMPTGSVWEVVIPPELAYGEQGSGRIGPHAVLIFKIELIAIVTE